MCRTAEFHGDLAIRMNYPPGCHSDGLRIRVIVPAPNVQKSDGFGLVQARIPTASYRLRREPKEVEVILRVAESTGACGRGTGKSLRHCGDCTVVRHCLPDARVICCYVASSSTRRAAPEGGYGVVRRGDGGRLRCEPAGDARHSCATSEHSVTRKTTCAARSI